MGFLAYRIITTFQGNEVFSYLSVSVWKCSFWAFRPLKMRTLRCVETWGFDYQFMPYLIPQELNLQPRRCANRTGKVKWHSPNHSVFSNGCSSVWDSWQITVTEHMSAYWTVSFGETTHRRQQILGVITEVPLLKSFTTWRKTVCRVCLKASTVILLYAICFTFLGTFAKLRKATISFVISVRPSVYRSARMEQLGSHWTDFHEVWYLSIFRYICRENCRVIKIWQE